MKFNLLETGYLTVSGTIYLSLEDMSHILSASGTVTISGAGGHNITFYGDIVDRIGTYQFRYYFTSATSSETVASGIHFYYKDDAADSYISLATNVGDGYYYATVPGLSAPRYIMLNHTLSGTSILGTIVGLQVLNDDSVVDFGTDGTKTADTTMTSLNYLNYSDYIKEIPIYNSGATPATAHVFLEPQYEDVDELISISDSEAGPWVQARNTDYIIVNADNWDCGQYYHTSTTGIADGKLRLNSGYTVGTYTTPIFKNDSVRFAYIDMEQTAVSGSIVAVDSDDYNSTIQIRSSSSKPLDYNIYRVLCYKGVDNSNQFWYKDYLVTTDTEVYDSYNATGNYFGNSWTYYSYTYVFDYVHIITNKETQKSAVITAHTRSYYPNYGTYRIEVILLSPSGAQLDFKTLAVGNFRLDTYVYNSVLYHAEFDDEGGIWLYNYIDFIPNSYTTTETLNNSYAISDEGYWLIHLDSNLDVTYNSGKMTSDFVGGFATAKNTSSLWYCNQTGDTAVVKLDSTGTVEVSYDSVTDLADLCATDDGGCWFIEGDNLYKLNSLGSLVDSITNLDINYSLNYVEFDLEDQDFLWIVDGIYIRRIRLDGTVFSSIYLEGFTIEGLLSTSEGLWVYCTDVETDVNYAKYIGKLSSGVEKTIECKDIPGGASKTSTPANVGIVDISYDNPVLGDLIPLSDDPVWNDTLSWNKAVTDNAILPREEYNQLKLTLRRPSVDINSPSVGNIYYQDHVELMDIYPGFNKILYLKISLPDGMTILGTYESMLKVWWEVSV